MPKVTLEIIIAELTLFFFNDTNRKPLKIISSTNPTQIMASTLIPNQMLVEIKINKGK